jgi:hypothetical protein
MAGKGIIAFIVLLVLLLLIAFVETGFNFANPMKSTTTIAAGTSTIPETNTSTTTTTINYTNSLYPCNNFRLGILAPNSTVSGNCIFSGGTLGLWVAGGDSGQEDAIIRGADGKTYINQSSTYSCMVLYGNFTAPAQIYTMTLRTGPGGGSCGYAMAELNTTTTPPLIVYNVIYNGDFGSGQYNGWTLTNPGFGTAPLNITHADSKDCYLGNSTWNNYAGKFFATTYDCGISVAAGNLTSSPFYANATDPFLNFKIISPDNSGVYVEIMQNGTPGIIAHYNTLNKSLGAHDLASTFMNASIPLTSLAGKAVRIRVVSSIIGQQPFVAVGDFVLSNRPVQQQGILTNITLAGK